MKNRLFRVFSLLLAVMMLSSPIKAFAVDVPEAKNDMVDVVIEITEDRCVIASVPREYAAEYQERLNSDPQFRQAQINEFNAAMNAQQQNSRSFPEGPIEYQTEFDEDDIRDFINSIAGPSTYEAQKQLAGALFDIAEYLDMLEDCNYATAMSFGANLLGIALSISAAQSEAWWQQAELDICNGIIRAVRYSIVQNVASEYPKVWRVFERI